MMRVLRAKLAYHASPSSRHVYLFHLGFGVIGVTGLHDYVCSSLHILDVFMGLMVHVLLVMLIVHLVGGFTLITVVVVPLVVQVCVHVLDVFSRVQLSGSHRESLLIEECNDALLAQHQLNHSFSFVLVKICVIFEGCRTRLGDTSCGVGCLSRIDKVNSDSKARLRRIDLHLGVLLVLLALRFDLINGLLQEDL